MYRLLGLVLCLGCARTALNEERIVDDAGSAFDADLGFDAAVGQTGEPTPDEGSVSPCDRPPLGDCVRGRAHADCGGDEAPAIYCDEHLEHCLWFEGGCPADGFPNHCADPNVTYGRFEPNCPVVDAYSGWGNTPWTLDAHMHLALEIDSALEPQPLSVRCDGCQVRGDHPEHWPEGRCLAARSFCDSPVSLADFRFGHTEDWGPRGLVAIALWDVDGLGGHGLNIELDRLTNRARICIIESTDTPTAPGSPICAVEGLVTISGPPDDRAALEALSGRFEARFDAFRPLPGYDPVIDGLTLSGSF